MLGGAIKRNGQDVYLEAQTIYSLDEVYRLSRRVRRIALDLGGEDRQTIRWILALLKSFRGDTEVRPAKSARPLPPNAARIEGRTTLFCPPVHLGLLQLLTKDRVHLEDAEGNEILIPEPATLG